METKRPVNPAAEDILGGYFTVLDHGFVALIDYMGTDDSVERAARVSYGYGTRKRSQTRALIRYLRRHQHTTPSEMVELQFHCAMPIFVARQWVRHRTACLAEGTELLFDLPGGIRRRGRQRYNLTIEEIWRRFQPTRNRTRPGKQKNPYFKRERLRRMLLRQINEESLRLQYTHLIDVFHNGPKPVFRLVLADGKTVEATADHRFLFAQGWRTLREATGLKEVSGKATWVDGDYFIYVNGSELGIPALYQQRSWLSHHYRTLKRPIGDIASDMGVSYATIRKWLRRHGLQASKGGRVGREPWNKRLRYELGPRVPSEAFLTAVRQARSGAASNFWRGGMSSERQSIARWTTQVAFAIHRRNGWTCQLCRQRASELHCHHIVPVWADPALARTRTNLTTLCGVCHRNVSGREVQYVERLGGPPVKANWHKRPRVAWNRLTVAKLVRIERLEFVGEKETYDVEVEGAYHNFIANGIVTHNSINEYSGRYSLMPLLFYRPEPENVGLQSRSNRQGRGEAAAADLYRDAIERWKQTRSESSDTYAWLVAEDVARELARIDLPLSTYTQWYWKLDLHNLMHFLTLRIDDHAQWEIREFAKVIAGLFKRVAPLSYEAWIDYDLAGRRFSRMELKVLRHLLRATEHGLSVRDGRESLALDALERFGLTAREGHELIAKLRDEERPDFELDLSRMRSAAEIEAAMQAAVPGALDPS